MRTLLEHYQAHTGKVTDRWASYLEEYQRIFAPFRNEPIRMLEIGVQNGGSLELWASYFSNLKQLIGCDIDERCGHLRFDDERVSVIVGDASQAQTYQAIIQNNTAFDVVIDDGSHNSQDIVTAFARYFPHISEGGVFVAEDLHCSYWREFQGGLFDPTSSIAFFKLLVDVVNHEHWGLPLEPNSLFSAFQEKYGIQLTNEMLATISRVEFCNSICVVHKRASKENSLGIRTIVGQYEMVTNNAKSYSGSTMEPLAQQEPGRPVIEAASLVSPHKSTVFADIERSTWSRVATISPGSATVTDLMNTVAARDEQLMEMLSEKDTPDAKLARSIVRKLNWALPKYSFRRQLAIKAVTSLVRSRGTLRNLASRLGSGGRQNPDTLNPTNGALVHKDAIGEPAEFNTWIQHHEKEAIPLHSSETPDPSDGTTIALFSIILPVYKVPAGVLTATVRSVQAQTFPGWELCIAYADASNSDNLALLQSMAAEDSRIRVQVLTDNKGISENSNVALRMAHGEFIALLDHDDELTPWALSDMANRIMQFPDTDFLYSDKDTVDASGSTRFNPLFKPSWSPEMMFSVNYVTHLNVIRRSVAESVGGWNTHTDGAQDWDLFFRVAERSRRIERVCGIHYHWRVIQGSTSTGLAAKPYAALGQIRALEGRIQRLGLPATVLPHSDSGFHIKWVRPHQTCVDLILVNRGPAQMPSPMLLNSLKRASDLIRSVQLIHHVHSDGASICAALKATSCKEFSNETELTARISESIDVSSAPVVVVVDTCIHELDGQALEDLVGWTLNHPEIAFASPLVLLKDDTVMEAGRLAGEDYRSTPLFTQMPLRHWGMLGGPLWYRNVSAASPFMFALKRSAIPASGWQALQWNQALTKLCALTSEQGLRGLVDPHARAYIKRIPDGLDLQWHESYRRDPYFHPAFDSVHPLQLGA